TDLPSGVNEAENTQSVWPARGGRSFHPSTSQNLTDWSPLAASRVLESAPNSSRKNAPEFPPCVPSPASARRAVKVSTTRPVAGSCRLRTPSSLAETSILPSGLKATDRTTSHCLV